MKRFTDSHIQGTNTQLSSLGQLELLTISAGGPGSGRKGHNSSSKLVWECKNCGTGMYKKDIAKGWGKTACKECGAARPKDTFKASSYIQSESTLSADQASPHPEKGKFKAQVYNRSNGFTVHSSPKGDKVMVQSVQSEGGRKMAKVVHTSNGNENAHVGSHTKMASLLTQKFGIRNSVLNRSAAKVV